MLKGAVPNDVYSAVLGAVRAWAVALDELRAEEVEGKIVPKCVECKERAPTWYALAVGLAAMVSCLLSPLSEREDWEQIVKALWSNTGFEIKDGVVKVLVAAETVLELRLKEGRIKL